MTSVDKALQILLGLAQAGRHARVGGLATALGMSNEVTDGIYTGERGARSREGHRLRVGLAGPLVPALADHLAVAHDDGPDHRIRPGRAAAALGQLERPPEWVCHEAASTRRR